MLDVHRVPHHPRTVSFIGHFAFPTLTILWQGSIADREGSHYNVVKSKTSRPCPVLLPDAILGYYRGLNNQNRFFGTS